MPLTDTDEEANLSPLDGELIVIKGGRVADKTLTVVVAVLPARSAASIITLFQPSNSITLRQVKLPDKFTHGARLFGVHTVISFAGVTVSVTKPLSIIVEAVTMEPCVGKPILIEGDEVS